MNRHTFGRGGLPSGEGGPVDLVSDLLTPLIRCHHEQVDLEVGLHGDQVRHPQEAGVDGRGVLHLEGGDYGIALQPEHVDQLNGPVGGVVKLPGKLPPQVGDVLKVTALYVRFWSFLIFSST